MNEKELINQKFGKLTIIEYDKQLSTEKKHRYWKCLCDCGNTKSIREDSLINGTTKSCGCFKARQQDLIGKVFGYLTVIERDYEKEKIVSNNNHYWKCLCKCGNTKTVKTADLNRGRTKSCGCLSIEKLKERNFIDLSNQKFGYLTPIQKIGVTKNGHSIWKCKCDCGNEVNVLATNLKTGHTISCGCFRGSKGENKIEHFLKSNNICYKRQYSFPDLTVNDTKLRFDFALFKDNQITHLIEYQGEQHFIPIEHWGGEQQLIHRQYCDNEKRNFCKKNNILLIEIPYNDFGNIEKILSKIVMFE